MSNGSVSLRKKITVSIPGLSDDEQRIINQLFDQLQDKQTRNLLRSLYYEGKHVLRVASPVVPDHYYKLGLVLGWSGKAVDALAQRTALETVDWPGGDIDSLGLPQLVEANQLRATLKGGQVNSLLHGVSWVVNTVGGENEPKSLIHVKDALSGTGRWNGRARRLESFLSITDLDGEGNPTGLVLYLPNLVVQCDKNGHTWNVSRSSHKWGIPVEPMAYKPWTREFGASRLTRPLMALQDRALNALIRLEGHMDVYSFPEFWMLGADSSVFKNPDGSLKPIVQVMLGRIKGIPDDDTAPPELARADVKQFPGNSPTPHLAALNAYAKLFARESGLPDSAMAITDYSNPTSADAYAESREDLIADAEGATEDWSVPVRRAVARGLAIQNGLTSIPDQWATMTPRWRSPLFQSQAAQADAGTKIVAAVPDMATTSVGLRKMGFTDDEIRQYRSEVRRANGGSVIDKLRELRSAGVNDAGNADRAAQPAGQPQ